MGEIPEGATNRLRKKATAAKDLEEHLKSLGMKREAEVVRSIRLYAVSIHETARRLHSDNSRLRAALEGN